MSMRMDLDGARAPWRLLGGAVRALAEFAGQTVHAVAGIGNPQRFFNMLRANGIEVIEHPLPDHAALQATPTFISPTTVPCS